MIYRGLTAWRDDEDIVGVEIEGRFYELRGNYDLQSVRGAADALLLHFVEVQGTAAPDLELCFSGVADWHLRSDPGGASRTGFGEFHYASLSPRADATSQQVLIHFHDAVLALTAEAVTARLVDSPLRST